VKRSWKLWVTGIAVVQLLVIGVDMALLWPMPSEAEQLVVQIRPGMSANDVINLAGKYSGFMAVRDGPLLWASWHFQDGSGFALDFKASLENHSVVILPVCYVSPAQSVPTQIRLRRTLARVLPFLAE
jgi:hypothetical protein